MSKLTDEKDRKFKLDLQLERLEELIHSLDQRLEALVNAKDSLMKAMGIKAPCHPILAGVITNKVTAGLIAFEVTNLKDWSCQMGYLKKSIAVHQDEIQRLEDLQMELMIECKDLSGEDTLQ